MSSIIAIKDNHNTCLKTTLMLRKNELFFCIVVLVSSFIVIRPSDFVTAAPTSQQISNLDQQSISQVSGTYNRNTIKEHPSSNHEIDLLVERSPSNVKLQTWNSPSPNNERTLHSSSNPADDDTDEDEEESSESYEKFAQRRPSRPEYAQTVPPKLSAQSTNKLSDNVNHVTTTIGQYHPTNSNVQIIQPDSNIALNARTSSQDISISEGSGRGLPSSSTKSPSYSDDTEGGDDDDEDDEDEEDTVSRNNNQTPVSHSNSSKILAPHPSTSSPNLSISEPTTHIIYSNFSSNEQIDNLSNNSLKTKTGKPSIYNPIFVTDANQTESNGSSSNKYSSKPYSITSNLTNGNLSNSTIIVSKPILTASKEINTNANISINNTQFIEINSHQKSYNDSSIHPSTPATLFENHDISETNHFHITKGLQPSDQKKSDYDSADYDESTDEDDEDAEEPSNFEDNFSDSEEETEEPDTNKTVTYPLESKTQQNQVNVTSTSHQNHTAKDNFNIDIHNSTHKLETNKSIIFSNSSVKLNNTYKLTTIPPHLVTPSKIDDLKDFSENEESDDEDDDDDDDDEFEDTNEPPIVAEAALKNSSKISSATTKALSNTKLDLTTPRPSTTTFNHLQTTTPAVPKPSTTFILHTTSSTPKPTTRRFETSSSKSIVFTDYTTRLTSPSPVLTTRIQTEIFPTTYIPPDLNPINPYPDNYVDINRPIRTEYPKYPDIQYPYFPSTTSQAPTLEVRQKDNHQKGDKVYEYEITKEILDGTFKMIETVSRATQLALEAIWPTIDSTTAWLEPIFEQPLLFMLAMGAGIIALVLMMMLVVYIVTYQIQPRDDLSDYY